MTNEKRLIDANALACKVDESKYNNPHPQGMVRVNHRNEHDHFLRMILDAPTVDAVEVVHIEKVKQEILGTFDVLIDTHRDISESSNDYYGIYAAAMEIARRLVNAALTDLCDNCGAKMDGDGNEKL